MTIRIGLIGKTNTGKTTFFNAATLGSAEISNYPFTTKSANSGVAYASTVCVHKEFDVKDTPRNSVCINGWRQIPIEVVDLPGLIKGAWMGKGLGNQFLTVASQSDALLHIVDASGSVDAEGKIAEVGTGDPVADIGDIEEELVMWYLRLIESNREKLSRLVSSGTVIGMAFSQVLGGIGITERHVQAALDEVKLSKKSFDDWSGEETKEFAWALRDISKPTLIVANKMDIPESAENFKRIQESYHDMFIVPSSAEAELTLRKAEKKGIIRYFPGEERFEVVDNSAVTDIQTEALRLIRHQILGEYLRTGVQFAINVEVFKLLRMNAVYPVYDSQKLTDKQGNILPDVFMMPSGSTVQDLAKQIHTELSKGILYAVDSRSGLRLPTDYHLKDRDVLSVVSASRKK